MNKILQYQSIFQNPPYTRTTSGTIFNADVWTSGGKEIFQHKPGAYF